MQWWTADYDAPGGWALEIHCSASEFSGPGSPCCFNCTLFFFWPRSLQVPCPVSVETFSRERNRHSTSSAHFLSLGSPVSRKQPPTAYTQNFLNSQQRSNSVVLAWERWRQGGGVGPRVWGQLDQHRKPFVSVYDFLIRWLTYCFLEGKLILPNSPLWVSESSFLITVILSSFMQENSLGHFTHTWNSCLWKELRGNTGTKFEIILSNHFKKQI